MDPLTLEILKTFVTEEFLGGSGVTVYRVMKKLNLYPSFIYKLIRKLENEGYIECKHKRKGRICRVTFLGMFEIYKRDNQLKIYIENLMSRALNIKDVESLRKILQFLIENNLTPRSYPEFIGFLILFFHIPEARSLLREVAKGLGANFVISPNLVYVKVNGSTYFSCEKRCDICDFKNLVCLA